jgi:class 3 adenylate cyclase/tetratricopeptide (TPR) repeat protein
VQTCQLCGGGNPPPARYCMGCGHSLGNVTRSEEVRRVTVLFADLVSSTALISRSDPEDARTLLDDVVRRLRAAVRQFGGTVVRVAGDGILALFGAPIPLEDHARRAALAALRMQANMDFEPIDGPGGARRMIRVGINTGDVLLRSVASDLHVEYSAEGVNTHLAAKLQQAADPGAVLVSAEVVRLIQGFVEVRQRAPMFIRGLESPVDVFELVRATGTQSRFQVAISRGLNPLIGRESAFAWLDGVAASAKVGKLRVGGVVGEPGIGKSRLLWEFGLRLRRRGWRVFSAQATLSGTAVAYHPILSVLRSMLHIEADDTSIILRSKLQMLATDGQLDIVPLLVLFDLSPSDAQWEMLDARGRQERTQDALAGALLAASRQRPTLVCIEDLHEVDTESLALVERLLGRNCDGSLVLLLEYRPGRTFAFERCPAFDSYSVEPLGEEAARKLFRQISGGSAPLAALEGQLIERVAGNPFFMEEGLRMLSELGALHGAERRTEEIPIPGSVMDVIESRIVQLPPAERELIKLASVVGKDSDLPMLQGLTGKDIGELGVSLGRLAEAGFLVEASDAALAGWSFKHAMTKDVAYRMMTRPERQGIHARIVGLLESKPLTLLPEPMAVLASHAVNAELWTQAVEYLQRGAELAFERASPREAVRLLDEALGLLPRLDNSVRTDERKIDIRLALRGPLLALGNLVRIGTELRHLESLAATCSDAVRLGRMAVVIAGHRWLSGELALAVESGRRAMGIAQQHEDFSLLVAARQYVGAALHELGEYIEAEELLTANVQAVPEDASGHQFGMAGLPAVFCRTTRGWLYGHLGQFAAARHDAEEAMRIARASGNGFSILSAVFTASALHLERAEFEAAEPLLQEGLSICVSKGQRMWLPVMGSMCALCMANLGQVEAARSLIDRAVPRPDNPLLTTFIVLTVVQAYIAMGRVDEAKRLTDASIERARKLGERIWEAEALALAGDLAALNATVPLSEAVAHYGYALTLAEALGMRPLAARCRLGIASCLAGCIGATQTLEKLSIAVTEFAALDLPAWKQRALNLEAQVRARMVPGRG